MNQLSRTALFASLFKDVPEYRARQFASALFLPYLSGFEEVPGLPKAMRETLQENMRWLSLEPAQVFQGKKGDTHKAILRLSGGERIETVLMQNARGHWTVCVSSQVGCAMACTFCATGKMGFTRNLSADEIIDQYRFWLGYLHARPEIPQYISNIVFMGMGEPLANYAEVRTALNTLLTYTEIGPTRITVSTVGLLPMLERLLDDPEWPPVRLAVSLHSADGATRRAIMPSSYDAFLEKLLEWTGKYFEKFQSRRRHLTFEYVMLSKVNDSVRHAEALIRFARRVGKVRINLIPYNFTGEVYRDSLPGDFDRFEAKLREAGVQVTRRRTMGDDIAAACGQLIVEKTSA
ncbi:MAG: hypothetical protein A2808_02315 [Candidatus Moranbacteria bacterium RIFCSPHIGHO2_01_FULL_55_24]|nr:MAG: hypothetical protein A2808_02315 [Candidatus Moranbacteria bacterium RIFCSPHIGHO2_01_FULL_55_24]